MQQVCAPMWLGGWVGVVWVHGSGLHVCVCACQCKHVLSVCVHQPSTSYPSCNAC